MHIEIVLVLMLVLAILGSASVIAAGGVDINWSVLAGGGGPVTAGTYSLNNTVGQATSGLASSGSTELCAGFWCMEDVRYPVYLPVLLHRSAH